MNNIDTVKEKFGELSYSELERIKNEITKRVREL